MENLPRVNILGVGINAITMPQALSQISTWIQNKERQYISVCTVHTIMECRRNTNVRQVVNNAGLATPDGMPLVWLSKKNSRNEVERVYGPDLMLALCRLSMEEGYSHYFYGGASGVPNILAQRLQHQFSGLKIAGCHSPPFLKHSELETPQVIDQINHASPHIIWVGLGTPKQDLWMAQHRHLLTAPVLIGVGAAFDIHSGRLPQAPLWMQNGGLEWLFRLYQEPRRLCHRYLVYNPLFVMLTLLQTTGVKNYRLDM